MNSESNLGTGDLSKDTTFWKFLPFWLFMTLYKFGGGLHYTLMAPLGVRLLPLWIVGSLISAAAFIEMLFDITAGRLLDKYGYIRFLRVTTMVFILAAICLFFNFTITTYIISLGFSVFGWLFFSPGVNAYVLSHAPEQHTGRFLAYRDIFGSIGIVLSSAALPYIVHLPVPYMGLIVFVLLWIAMLFLTLSPKDKTFVPVKEELPIEVLAEKKRPFMSALQTVKKLNPASSLLLVLGLAAGAFYGIIWFVIPIVIAQQINGGLLGIGLGIFDFAVVVLGFALGNLADRANKRTLVFIGLLLFSMAGLLLGFNFGWLFILLGFISTAGDEMAGLALWAWLHCLDSQHEHTKDGEISGIISLFQDLGWAIGPFVAGILYSVIGPSYTIAIGAIPILFLLIGYQLFLRNKHDSNVCAPFPIPPKPTRLRAKN